MSTTPAKPHVFVSYSHRDSVLKREFDTNLRVMQRQGIIDKWTDGEIQPGDRWAEEITAAMERSQIIIFLVSNNFLDSDFIRNVEAPMAMRMRDQGRALIVPVLLRTTPGWINEDWYSLQALPSELKPIEDESWPDVREAFAAVEKSLRDLIAVLPDQLAKQSDRRLPRTVPGASSEATSCAGVVEVSRSNDARMTHRNVVRRPRFWASTVLSFVGIAVAGVLLFQARNRSLKSYATQAPSFIPVIYPASKPFENSLGMRFVSLSRADLLCSIWELRVGDFKAFAQAAQYEVAQGMETFELNPQTGKYDWGQYGKTWRNPGFFQTDDHPVVGITMTDAKKFCEWLTDKERTEKILPAGFEYRVIRDHEWSMAAGDTLYPWNAYEIPPSRRGNYNALRLGSDNQQTGSDSDPFAQTAPVGSFDANPLGIFDLGGNVREECDTPYLPEKNSQYLLTLFEKIRHNGPGIMCARGGSWSENNANLALTDIRWPSADRGALADKGYRIVLAASVGSTVEQEGWTTVSNFNFETTRSPSVSGGDGSYSGNTVTLSGESLASAFCPILSGRELKDFEAEVRYRVITASPESAEFGIAFEFRNGLHAKDGYRVFIHGEAGTWGRGYWRTSGSWQSYPFRKITAGRMNLDRSLNSFRVIVRGDSFKLYSNDCLIGSEEFDAAQLSGGLKLMVDLSESTPKNPSRMVTIEFENLKVRELN